jgi:hypothetical protein
VRNCAQCSTRNPCSSTFVPGNRSPPTGTYLFAPSINATTDRSGAGDDNQSGFTFGGPIECNVSISHHNDFPNAGAVKRFADTRPQLIPAGTRQSNLSRNQIRAP